MRKTPNWDSYSRKPMSVPLFAGQKGLVTLDGFCRGHGPITSEEKAYQDTIGIYTADGIYHGIQIDTRVKCAAPQFFIDGQEFFYPITACSTACGGLSVVDPATGNLMPPRRLTPAGV